MAGAAKIRLTGALGDWRSKAFAQDLRRQILALEPGTLPLQLAASRGGVVTGARDVTILHVRREGGLLLVRIGVFFTEVVGGCSCGDDPFTTDDYCELYLRIDTASSRAEVSPP